MSAYYAPAFFAHLLGRCIQRRSPVSGVLKLGFVVLITFTICWWPFLSSLQSAGQVNVSQLVSLDKFCSRTYFSMCNLNVHNSSTRAEQATRFHRVALLMSLGFSKNICMKICADESGQKIETDEIMTQFAFSIILPPSQSMCPHWNLIVFFTNFINHIVKCII